jgi:hypothetical protein
MRADNVYEFDRRFLAKTKDKPCGMPGGSYTEPKGSIRSRMPPDKPYADPFSASCGGIRSSANHSPCLVSHCRIVS